MHFSPELILFLKTFGLVIGSLTLAHVLLIRRNRGLGNEKLFSRQLIMLGLSLAGILAITFSLPIAESSRNQLIALIGLLISGVFAFSSSNIFSNLAAGILLRVTKPFAAGDFVRIADHFGRVYERGLFTTEIQSETGELLEFPNTFMVQNPISTVRAARAVVSSTVSLGYDVHHSRIGELLLQAAEASGLQDAFVHVLELGDFSINYRVSGVLPEAKMLVTAQSELNKSILDALHENDVEIVSPAFMNQRQLKAGLQFIPARSQAASREPAVEAEQVLFDKAELAGQMENQITALKHEITALEHALKSAVDDEKKEIKALLANTKERLTTLLSRPVLHESSLPDDPASES